MGLFIGDTELNKVFVTIDDYSAMQGPCPNGFHIPTNDELEYVEDTGIRLGAWQKGNGQSGRGDGGSQYLKLPYGGYIDNSGNIHKEISASSRVGYYWSCEHYYTNKTYASGFTTSSYASGFANALRNKTYGCFIRPFKNIPEIPNNSWTTLFNGSSIATGAGIFYNSSLGLISISSDGKKYVTMTDKNLGATQVWNMNDNLTQEKCGNFYQWGNNYGFEYDNVSNISTTQIDASSYGPGNYYSSSTFISGTSNNYIWDTSNNGDLWGGETGIQRSQKKVSYIYAGDNKVLPTTTTEYIEIVMACDSNGDLKIPVAGYTTNSSQNAPYSRNISYDNGTKTRYIGTGSTTPLTIASGLVANSEHTVKITPIIENYGWARAFGFYNSGINDLLKSITYDGSYMGYSASSTNTGDYFRYNQYQGCTSLITAPAEVLPSSVTSIGSDFRYNQYQGCTSLITAPAEVLPSSVTSIGNNFRGSQYYGCTGLTTAPQEVLPNTVTSIRNYFRRSQYYGCTGLTTAPQEVLPSSVISIGNYFRNGQYQGCTSLTTASAEVLPSSITSIGTYFRSNQYNGCTSLTSTAAEVLPTSVTSIGNYFRYHQYDGCTSLTTASAEVLPSSITSIGTYFRGYQYQGCTGLTTAPAEVLPNTITSIGNYFRCYQYNGCTSLTTAPTEVLPSSVISIGTYFRRQQYYGCTSLTAIEGWKDLSIGNSNYRTSQFANCTSNKTIKVLSDIGYSGASNTLSNSYVTQVQVPSAYLSNFTGTTTVYPRRSITDSKFVGY